MKTFLNWLIFSFSTYEKFQILNDDESWRFLPIKKKIFKILSWKNSMPHNPRKLTQNFFQKKLFSCWVILFISKSEIFALIISLIEFFQFFFFFLRKYIFQWNMLRTSKKISESHWTALDYGIERINNFLSVN